MDIEKVLKELYQERAALDEAIASLEKISKNYSNSGMVVVHRSGRRGRKSMSTAEREKVSERMTRYWADRRRKDQSSSQVN